MPLILPANSKSKTSTGKKVGAPLSTPRSAEVKYREALFGLTRNLGLSTRLIADAIRGNMPHDYVMNLLRAQIAKSQAIFDMAAKNLPNKTFSALSDQTKAQAEGMIKKALGVDFAMITDNPEVGQALNTATMQNAQLITNMSTEHWTRVTQIVTDNYAGRLDGSLLSNLIDATGITKRRAKLIARDQTAKFASDLNRIRQQNVGIESYIWRTSKDARVVGTPGGLYPKGSRAHENHYAREGKEFRWDDPPSDGNPGIPINCRCTAQPVINLDKLDATYL